MVEETKESVKKKDLIEYSENKIFSTFRSKAGSIFNKGLLVFDSKNQKLFKVVDVKNDENGKTTWVKLVLNNGDEHKEINKEEDLDDFRDYLLLNLVVSTEKKERTIFQVKQKLYEKLETNLEPMLKSIGISSFATILFFKGKFLDKDGWITQAENIFFDVKVLLNQLYTFGNNFYFIQMY